MDQDMSVAFTEADSDQEMESLMLCENDASDDDDGVQKITTKKCAKILSDSEDDEENVSENTSLVKSDAETDKVPSPKPFKKISALIDSDSEPEVNRSDAESTVTKSKSSSSPKKRAKKKSGGLLSSLNLDFGSSSDSDESTAGSVRSHKSVSEDELSGDEFIRKAGEESKGHPDGKKQQRMSAKEAMEQMKVIQSESQRMAREAYVDIPYHKPKQHSLKEFLSRKGVARKNIPKASYHKTTAANVKMSQEELEAYEKLLKEREKEAAEFFKSESEEEEEVETNNPEETTPEVTAPEVEKTNAELLKEMDDALSTAIGQQDEIMSLIENAKHGNPDEMTEKTTETDKISEPETPDTENVEIVETGEPILEPPVIETDVSEEFEPEKSSDECSNQKSDVPINSETRKSKLLALIGDLALPELKPMSYDPTLEIDLETGDVRKKELSGPELLKEKYLKNAIVKSQVPHDTDLKIVSLENGLHVEHVMVKPDIDTLKVKKDVKPGAAYMKLKQELEKKITENRMKSVQEREGYEKKLEEEQKQYSGDEEEDGESDVQEENDMEDPPETEVMDIDAPEENEDLVVPEEIESDADSDSSDDTSDDEELPNPSTGLKKGRIITAFVDSDEEIAPNNEESGPDPDVSLSDSLPLGQVVPQDKEGTLLETSLTSDTSFKVPETPTTSHKSSLEWETAAAQSLWDNDGQEEDLSELCSGRFGPTQAPILTQDAEQVPPSGIKALCDKGLTQGINEEDLSELCSGTFNTQMEVKTVNNCVDTEDKSVEILEKAKTSPKSTPIIKRNVILSSDEEINEVDVDSAKKVKKLKKKKRRRQALEISDDESSESENDETDEIEAEESPIEDPEEAEVFLDYDSEENEIEVKLTKQDRQKVATNYFENEAELSGDEVGSADEDEKDLDRFERELGDEEQFDQDQLQSELGKIHMRRILDQDNREVKILQEMFFEDEEKDGIGRTRKFMWKNIDGVMNLMEGVVEGGDDDPQGPSDDENEEEWRKMRHERESLLAKNNEEKENSLQLSIQNVQEIQSDTVTETSLVTKRKITIVKKQSTTDTILTNQNKTDSPFLISFGKVFKESRASFLARDEETLNKLAGMVKETDGDEMATSLGKAKNFVFSVITPPSSKESDKMTNKRPSDAVQDIPGNSKRQKLNDKFKKRLLDSLA